jgi:FKBP-type peptidyl-prolyl cis-trans isomerase FklB
MTRMFVVMALASVFVVAAAAQEPVPPGKSRQGAKAPVKTDGSGLFKSAKERKSYVMGFDIATSLRRTGYETADIDVNTLFRGFSDGLDGRPQMSTEEIRQTMELLQTELATRQKEMFKAESDKNKREAKEFFAANVKKTGIKTTKSGLQYKVLAEGTGPTPKATDTVKTHYHGTFLNGRVFDSSVERGEPFQLPVNQFVPGWREALQMMKVGSKWQLFVPSELAYGEGGTDMIPPNAALVFELELLDIVKEPPQPE